jgi:uncharacterized protein with GYD domain
MIRSGGSRLDRPRAASQPAGTISRAVNGRRLRVGLMVDDYAATNGECKRVAPLNWAAGSCRMTASKTVNERNLMARYISLLRFTEQGAKNIKKSIQRAHDFSQAAAGAGVRIEGQYWTLGGYDGVLILSADTQEKALHCLADLAAEGNVRTETLQAFTDAGFAEITGQ